jgi:hypothetical protein
MDKLTGANLCKVSEMWVLILVIYLIGDLIQKHFFHIYLSPNRVFSIS